MNISPRRFQATLLAGFLFLPLLLSADETTQQQKLQAEREHFDRQLQGYKTMRDKVERGSVSEAQWLAAQNLEDTGMETLKELSVITSFRDITKSIHLHSLKDVPLSPVAANVVYVGEAVVKAWEANAQYEKSRRTGLAANPAYRKSAQEKLDQAIAVVEQLKRPLPLGETWVGQGKSKEMECLFGTALMGLYVLKSGYVESGEERLAWRAKAGKEGSDAFLKATTFGQPKITSYAEAVDPAVNRSGVLALSKLLAEEAARLMVATAAISWSDAMQTEALVRKENTLSDLDYRIMVAGYERDKVLAAQRRLERGQRVKEPGGIKFSSARADELGRHLDIDSITFDPVRGRLILAGRKSTAAFDLDLFKEVLQLAVEESEPFFSLEPSAIGDWDHTSSRIALLFREKYETKALIARVHDLCRQPIQHGGRTYYYATTDQLDPVLAAQANDGFDISEKLVFSPNWLRYSKLGWILYEADVAIKGIAAGFLERWPHVIPSPAWETSDFRPEWLVDRGHYAGRANFELDDGALLDAEGRRSLGDVRPKLIVAAREPGSPADLQPTPPWCLEISAHFSKHWEFYVERIPELRQLQTVFKAYVAARLLVREHPGLAERVRGLTPPIDWQEQPPLRVIRPSIIRVCYVDGKPAPIAADRGVWWDIGGGYGGGAAVHLRNLEGAARTAPPAPWTSNALLDPSSPLEVEEQGDRAAVPLDIVLEPPPSEPLEHGTAALVVFLLGVALLGVVLGRWDWQQLAPRETCTHCGKVHAWAGRIALVGSVTTAASLFFLAGLPLLLAGQAEEEAWKPLLVSAILIPGAVAILTLLGRVALGGLALARRRAPLSRGVLQEFVAGAQLGALALLLTLWRHGVSPQAVLGAWQDLYGVEIAERLLAQLSNPQAISWGVWGLAIGSGTAILSRSVAPFLFGSRPLSLSPTPSHRHSS